MATVSSHTRNDSGVSVRSFVVYNPPSPTLTNPDMIMPISPWQNEPMFDEDREGPHPLLEPEGPLSRIDSNTSVSTARGDVEEVGIATVVPMPNRLSVRAPTTIHGQATPIPTYMGYEHGAPLSDIYEESEATATPKSVRTMRDERSISPTPARESSVTPTRQMLRHKKRISSLSTSSSGGSDVGDWETFDTSKVLSSRVAADLAQMRREDSLDVETQDMTSRRQSREEEELAALNARAEKILENARKRLTHMEDNLKVARTSIIFPQRSPNLGGEHQPVGGLYRSISAAGANKLAKNRQYPQIRTSSSLQHIRGNSETGLSNTTKRLSRLPDTRSASALEYGSPARYSLFPDLTQPAPAKVQVLPSPSSSRSHNSPLRPLEEESGSPSTVETTPESVKIPPIRGLGIMSSAAHSKENLVMNAERPPSRQAIVPTLVRSTSSASNRSTKDLKDQMSDLKSRIAGLKSKAKADHARRQSLQSVRSSSPFTNSQPEQWYTSSPNYNETGSPVNASAGLGWTVASSPTLPRPGVHELGLDRHIEPAPTTPINSRHLDVDRMSPGAEAKLLSSARTDRNTPSLARKSNPPANHLQQDDDEEDRSSVIHQSQTNYRNAARSVEDPDYSDQDTERIAETEEEQIYLNEVLEESLHDAEVEPEVPAIPGSFLEDGLGMPLYLTSAAERHEDRLDAFDYENMFLHSAMGTYTGKSLNGSDSGSDMLSDDIDGSSSVETSRADVRTPVDDSEGGDIQDENMTVHEDATREMENVKSSKLSPERTDPTQQVVVEPTHPKSLMREFVPSEPNSWTHARTKSMDSVSTSATFETATEGERYDETLSEIYDWDPMSNSNLAYSPTSYQAYRSNKSSPVLNKHGFSSPQAGGRTALSTNPSPAAGASLKQRDGQRYQNGLASPGLGIGIIGAENGQYIDDSGVPQRFRGKPSPVHSREPSLDSPQHDYLRPESTATIIAVPPMNGHQRQKSSTSSAVSRVLSSSPLTPAHRRVASGTVASPVVVTVTSSPQRKVVINRALRRPESYKLEPQLSNPPNMPLPPPPASSAALQAQMASPKKVDIKGSNDSRSSTARKHSPHLSHSPATSRTPPSMQQNSTSSPSESDAPIPNIEVLMESLIKLADPSFSLAPGIRFDEIDKNLVLGLLGAVGGVCNSMLRAGIQRGSPSVSRSQTEEKISKLRRRLENAADTLEGRDEENSLDRERRAFGETGREARGLRIKEI